MNISSNSIYLKKITDLEPLKLDPLNKKEEVLDVPKTKDEKSGNSSGETEEKIKTEEKILKQMDQDFKLAVELTGLNSVIGLSQNSSDLANIGRNIFKGIEDLQESGIDLADASISLDIVSNNTIGVHTTLQIISFCRKSQEMKKLQTLISEKKLELESLHQKNEKTPVDYFTQREIALAQEIKSLEEESNKLLNQAALGLLCAGISLSSDSLTTASSFVSLATPSAVHASNILGNVAGGVTAVGLLVSMCASGHGIYQANHELSVIIEETDRLLQKLEKDDLEETVKSIIEMRLKALEQMHDDLLASMMKDYLSLGCSTIGTITAISGLSLAAAGVASGAAVTAVTTAGVSIGVVGAGLLAAGIGYAAYKNRKIIEIRLEQVSKTSKGKIKKFQIKKAKTSINQLETSILKIQGKIKKINEDKTHEKKLIEEQIHEHQNLISNYVQEKVDPTHPKNHSKKHLEEQLNKEFQILNQFHEQIDKIDSSRAQLIENQIEKLNRLTSTTNSVFKNISDLKIEVNANKKELDFLKIEEKFQNITKCFAQTTPDQLKEIMMTWTQQLQSSPVLKESVKEFIFNEGLFFGDFDTNPMGGIFSYLTNKVQQEKVA